MPSTTAAETETEMHGRRARRAFASAARSHRAGQSIKAVWWAANSAAARALVQGLEAKPDETVHIAAAPPSPLRVRRAWMEAFEKDAADVAAGLYPVRERGPGGPWNALAKSFDVIADARRVADRRARSAATEARDEPGSAARPAYYRQNFHFQTGGWFTVDSARRYEAQVEALFAGSAGAMRRRALSLLARAWRGEDQRGRLMVDVACGSGAFLIDLKAAFPRAGVFGLDLSHAYLAEASRRSGAQGVQAQAERLPLAGASLDAVTCIYLFHELPPRVREEVAVEIARVLKPGGVLAFADSVQASDAPDFARLLEAFPVHFHEPFYASYQTTDLAALFSRAGLTQEASDTAFLTKALLFRKGA